MQKMSSRDRSDGVAIPMGLLRVARNDKIYTTP
ncbi:MAG: hypothetical protein UT63_C0064G0022 [Candidatus Gottesmanbacteria bacterium GW2011_GWC2_39_8]|uniref:Uncharacterized protein n=1 Tax=Candidatus Gottesmanbacteria bacterium GW2011_GWC2_39_8 TaxID=1618450 RepID=A0A0G0SA72_9BACT|nr:MAG: hypothetical protein UT63_C0064G0022 [Candidatus Gottesmanbacteria bacterium GW2011_GWC2_39_8]